MYLFLSEHVVLVLLVHDMDTRHDVYLFLSIDSLYYIFRLLTKAKLSQVVGSNACQIQALYSLFSRCSAG